MLGSSYETQTCSVARALEVVGERWTLLVLRDLLLGLRRFDELQADLGVARNVLSARLEKLEALGVVRRVPYSERPLRHEYRLTDAGRDLWPTVHALMSWGDRHATADGGPPVVVRHRGCGGAIDAHRVCLACHAPVELHDVQAEPGPGAGPDHPLRHRPERTPRA